MTIDCGYGADIEESQFKADAAKTIYPLFAGSVMARFQAELAETNKSFVYEHGLPALKPEEFLDDFCTAYDNDDYGWGGIEGVITDVINACEFNDETVFRCDGGYIYVSADIPEDDADRDRMLTKARIRAILDKYLRPCVTDELSFSYVDICER